MFKHYLLSLLYYKKRTFLSILGVSLGIAILTIVLSLGASLRSFISKQIEAFGQKTLFISPKPPEINELGTIVLQSQGVRITTLQEKDLKDISRLPYVEAASGAVMTTEWIKYQNKEKQTTIIGVYPDYKKIDKSFEIMKGRMFRDSENEGLARVAVIGYEIYNEFFKNKEPIGKYIKIRGINFKVIGVTKKRGGLGFIDIDSLIFLPTKTLQKLLLGINYFSEIDVSVKKIEDLPIVKKISTKILRGNHHLKETKKNDFEIMTSEETIKKTSQITLIVDILLFLLAFISLIVGGVGIMNMMLISVKERTKEIGLRKAVGAKNSDILYQFLSETIVVVLLGACLGIIFGIVFILLVFLFLKYFGIDWQLKISFFSLFLGLFLAFLEGLIFGLWPAYQASKKNPVEALRE